MSDAVVPLFLDTTIQVDRVLKKHSVEDFGRIQSLLESYGFTATCSFSKLEFKRVVLQNIRLVLEYVAQDKSFFGAMSRCTRLQRDRQVKTLENILSWVGLEVDDGSAEVIKGDSIDAALAEKAATYCENAIEYLWEWFDLSVDKTTDQMRCQRAKEGPERKPNGDFNLAIHEKQCQSQKCNNAGFFQSHLPRLKKLASILRKMHDDGNELRPELLKALSAIEEAIDDRVGLYDYQECLRMGDVWIHLEACAAKISDFATTNYRESEILCPILELTMKNPRDNDVAIQDHRSEVDA